MADELFAGRHGFTRPKPITYHEELPTPLVAAAVRILCEHMRAEYLRETCEKFFDPYRTVGRFYKSANPLVDLSTLCWYELYSLIEHVAEELIDDDTGTLTRLSHELSTPLPPPFDGMVPSSRVDDPSYDSDQELRAPRFGRAINDFFVHEGIGWQLDGEGKVVTRGDENFTESVEGAISKLDDTGRPTAAQHLKASRQALSERPKPDTAGAVSRATSAVECVLHDITGESMTLGKYLSAYPGLFHPALQKGLDGIYGYASDDGARHGKEGTLPTPEAARFVVATCSSICTLLAETNPKN